MDGNKEKMGVHFLPILHQTWVMVKENGGRWMVQPPSWTSPSAGCLFQWYHDPRLQFLKCCTQVHDLACCGHYSSYFLCYQFEKRNSQTHQGISFIKMVALQENLWTGTLSIFLLKTHMVFSLNVDVFNGSEEAAHALCIVLYLSRYLDKFQGASPYKPVWEQKKETGWQVKKKQELGGELRLCSGPSNGCGIFIFLKGIFFIKIAGLHINL